MTPSHDEACGCSHLELNCPAKVNLALSVGAADATGMHPIASWMIALDFGDTLELTAVAGTQSRFDIRFDAEAPQPQPVDWPLEKDLAFRAHALVQAEVGRSLAIDAVLRKRIPAGAGLGGGSSDAAAMLVGLNTLFDLNLPNETLLRCAAELGSDVVFLVAALLQSPSAIVAGRGEQIETTPLARAIDLVLILPPLQCPTGPVYAAFDAIADMNAIAETQRIRKIATCLPIDPEALFNDLAEPAQRVTPSLRTVIASVTAATKRRVHVTGSGAAMFIVADSGEDARSLAGLITTATNLPAVATRSLMDSRAPAD